MAKPEKPRTVLMVLEATFPVIGGGGAESQVMNLARNMLARGQPVEVIVPMVPNGRQIAHETCEGVRVTRIAYPHVPLLGGAVMLFNWPACSRCAAAARPPSMPTSPTTWRPSLPSSGARWASA
jgi:hypothetical protein